MRWRYAPGFWGSKFNQIVSHRQVPNAPGPMPPQSLGHAMEDTYILLPNAVSCNLWVCAEYAPNRKLYRPPCWIQAPPEITPRGELHPFSDLQCAAAWLTLNLYPHTISF